MAEALTVYTLTICTRYLAATPVSPSTSVCGGRALVRGARCPIFPGWRSGPFHSVVEMECICVGMKARNIIQSVHTHSFAFRSRKEDMFASDVVMYGEVDKGQSPCK